MIVAEIQTVDSGHSIIPISRGLILLEQAEAALAAAETIDDLKKIRDAAEALRVCAKKAQWASRLQNRVTTLKIRSEWKAGEVLKKIVQKGGNPKSRDVILADIGVSAMQSKRWQDIHSIPRAQLERHFEAFDEADRELTTKSVLKLAKRQPRHPDLDYGTGDFDGHYVDDLAALAGRKFGTVYADPPWNYGNQATRASTDNHYETMSVDDLCAMPIAELVEDRAHLHLWTTNGFLEESFRIMRAWGFEFKSCLVWIKPQMGIGNYYRLAHEFLMLGTRGAGVTFPAHAKNIISWVQCDRGEHSAKPDEARKIVETASPAPYLELFGRERIPGWTVFGNQINPQRRLA